MLRVMPTVKPRLTITLTPQVAAILRELSALAGNSQSAIVGELLQMSAPVFERVVAGIRAAKMIQESAKAEIAAGLERAQVKAEAQLGIVLEDLDAGIRPILEEAEKVRRRGPGARTDAAGAAWAAVRRRGSTPVPVTRGSGSPAKGPARAKRKRRGRV